MRSPLNLHKSRLFTIAIAVFGLSTLFSSSPPSSGSLLSDDHFQFGRLWKQIKRLQDDGQLYDTIWKRREEIAAIKARWKEKVDLQPFPSFLNDFEKVLTEGTLILSEVGCGSTYFLLDRNQNPRFVIKPLDEAILCLNNPKHFGSPYNQNAFRVRDHIPLYRSAQAEALSYALARLLGFGHLTPPTYLTILTHDQFFDVVDRLDLENDPLRALIGAPDKEKLCSIQPYITNIVNLHDLVDSWLQNASAEKEILTAIDIDDFEDLFLLIWLLYDTDAHAGNLYAQPDQTGVYHLFKIDNGLTFPDKNANLLNALFFFPHANTPPSERVRTLIQILPLDTIAEQFRFFDMEDALEAFYERVEILKHLLKNPSYTFRDIDVRLRTLNLPDGPQIALSHLSLNELEKLISYP